jgi:GNAT superfamily N-acetyltransferase
LESHEAPALAVSARLNDGTEVVLRPLSADDKPLLREGMARLSDDSRRMRFMTSVDRLTRAQLAYLTEVDQTTHLAWGALIGDQPVGVGRVVRSSEVTTQAEFAVTVVDGWQRHGLGRLLLTLLAALARDIGVERFIFYALAENRAILGLLEPFGATWDIVDGIISGSLDLASVPTPELTGDIHALAAAARETG